ncbi:MAG TPA: serine/threonine protein kinase [Streptosporangiaceae bacterium]|nr:serine/threonine protein kinase [Streptosporangiaceae bacterium]
MQPAPPLASSSSALLAGRYRLIERIGTDVWRGTDVVLGRPVAVELLRIEFPDRGERLARFRERARQAGSVAHAGIARVYDYDEACAPHPPFLVTELTDGPSLAEVIARSAPLEPWRAMDIVAQVAAALCVVHGAGLVHGAVRPENILTTRDGQVKLTGLTGQPASAASDLYALGVVARECLTGRPPDPARPAEVSALIDDVTAADPARRPSAGEVAFRAARLRDRMLPVQPATLPQPVRPNGRKWTWRRALLPSLAIPVVVIAGLFLSGWRHVPHHPAPAAVTMVQVNGTALAGRPVGAVRALLRREGLAVSVRWLPSSRVPAGRVISVAPAGRVPAGTLVTVTGALRPTPSYTPSAPSLSSRPASGHRAHHAPTPRPTAPRNTAPAPTSSPSPTATPSSSPSPTSSSSPTSSTGTPAATQSSLRGKPAWLGLRR